MDWEVLFSCLLACAGRIGSAAEDAVDVGLDRGAQGVGRHLLIVDQVHHEAGADSGSAAGQSVIPVSLMDLTRSTYFKVADPQSPLTAPLRYDRPAELPPTLILTAEHDTLRHEMNELADELAAKGMQFTHRECAGVDHGFTHVKPVEVAREAITMIGDPLRRTYA